MYDRQNPALLDVLAIDDALPVNPMVLQLWLVNLRNPLRKNVLLVLRFLCSVLLCTAYFIKRLLPFQFSAPTLLQRMICWFMEWFVSPEANVLILRHFGAESNVINFIIANSRNSTAEPATLYPARINDLMTATFLKHDIVLFNALYDLGPTKDETWPVKSPDFSTMRPVVIDPAVAGNRRWTQVLDFETAHELFKTLFCVLVTADEYERSINSLQLDQTLAIRVARIVGDAEVAAMPVNKVPLFLLGPLHLSQRFVMHGLFTEHLHAYLEELQVKAAAV